MRRPITLALAALLLVGATSIASAYPKQSTGGNPGNYSYKNRAGFGYHHPWRRHRHHWRHHRH